MQRLRRKLVPYVFINSVLIALSIFSDSNVLPVVGIWTLYIAYQYTKLWAEGYDWRDVLRQPNDRLFGDWLSEVGEHIQGVFSSKKREQLRREGRTRGGLSRALSPRTPVDAMPATSPAPTPAAPTRATGAPPEAPHVAASTATFGAHARAVDGARGSRAELLRLVHTTPVADRAQLPDVESTSRELVARVETLATTLAATDALLADRSLDAIDREIAQLEAQEQASDAVARKLAMLHRTRRATAELEARRQTLAPQLDACLLALETMRMDLVRVRTGDSTLLHVTTLAQEAMQLAQEVDRAVASAQDLRQVTAP